MSEESKKKLNELISGRVRELEKLIVEIKTTIKRLRKIKYILSNVIICASIFLTVMIFTNNTVTEPIVIVTIIVLLDIIVAYIYFSSYDDEMVTDYARTMEKCVQAKK